MSKKLENLIAGHAYWSDKKNELKLKGSEESWKCVKAEETNADLTNTTNSINCIEAAFNYLKELREDGGNYGEVYLFDEAWGEIEPCIHCQNVRDLKAERMKASRRLGAIRGAITKIGRKLEYNQKASSEGAA